jgi:hypothetical protein
MSELDVVLPFTCIPYNVEVHQKIANLGNVQGRFNLLIFLCRYTNF